MLTVFQVCFFVGIALTILEVIFGSLMEGLGMDGLDLDFPGVDFMIPLNPVLLVAFLLVFGGSGWIFLSVPCSFPLWLITVLSGVIGLFISMLLYSCIIRPLKKAQNTSAPETEELIGLGAKVTETIKENGFGEITYVIHGNSYTSPAKSSEGKTIKVGSNVAICWVKDHVFYVTNINL